MIIGAGALGLGFLAERMSPDYDLCMVDLLSQAFLLTRIRDENGYTMNLCGSAGLEHRRVYGTFTAAHMDLPDLRTPIAGSQSVAAALEAADLVLTAVGSRALPSVVAKIAPVLNARNRRVWLLFCENGLGIAAAHGTAFAANVTAVDTVMSRMCRFGEVGETGYAPLWPGAPQHLIAEAYAAIPLDRTLCQHGPFSAAFTLVESADFRMWKDIKLFMHNGMHAFMSYHAFLEGTKFLPDISSRIREAARRVMLQEVVPAILHHHPRALQPAVERYGLELLERFVDPCFHDSIERGVRGVEEKLAPGERLLAGQDFISQAGIQPRGYSSTIDAAREIVRLKGGRITQ